MHLARMALDPFLARLLTAVSTGFDDWPSQRTEQSGHRGVGNMIDRLIICDILTIAERKIYKQ